jgi:acyl-CoA synthetase (AMP-forming)/AMP-acid ligase II
MADTYVSKRVEPAAHLNVADRLAQIAAAMPNAVAVACPRRSSPAYPVARKANSGAAYATTTFAELDADATRLARGLVVWGIPPSTRLALLARPGIEFVTLVFSLLRAGMVIVLIDTGFGRRNLIRCLQEAEPEGFAATGAAQATRLLLRYKFPKAQWNITVGRRWFWGGLTLDKLRSRGDASKFAPLANTRADDAAAIIFTSGSTGPPKGVLYTHRMFERQVSEIQSMYGIEAGGLDLACFPLFALFNAAMGVTTVLPDMDFSRPAAADPRKLLAAANDWKVTQAFASPAVWRVVSEHCAQTGERIPSLGQVFSCGAPVPADILRTTRTCIADDAKMHTPYGATECLPVATIEAAEVLRETAQLTEKGAGICVGRNFDSIEWRVVRITDEPIATIEEVEELPPGEIGELIVRGPQTSPRYVTRPESNCESKITDSNGHWHRMGDVGYLDDQGRFWYCGRKSQRVETDKGTLFTECVEAVVNTHPDVRRCALVGARWHDRTVPLLVVEREEVCGSDNPDREILRLTSSHADMSAIEMVLYHDELPVDVRHNSKIRREELATWATGMLTTVRIGCPQPQQPSS